MATELETKLNTILEEKTNKIIPTNIRKGVNVLGVEGEYGVEEFKAMDDYMTCLATSNEILAVSGWEENKTFIAEEIQASHSDRYNDACKVQNKCQVDGSNAWWFRAYLLHDFDKLLAKKDIVSIKSATFHFRAFWGNDYYTESVCYLGQLSETWDETSTDWTNQPTIPDYTEGNTLTPSWNLNVTLPYDYEIDVTDIVKSWFNGETNYGIGIRAIEEGGWRHDWHFYNRRYNNGQYATYIEVVYDEYLV